jgi:hypothetical protein
MLPSLAGTTGAARKAARSWTANESDTGLDEAE